MLTRVDLTMDCTDPDRLATFWKIAAGYVDEPPPQPFSTREEWLATFDDEDDGMAELGCTTRSEWLLASAFYRFLNPRWPRTDYISISGYPETEPRLRSGRQSFARSNGYYARAHQNWKDSRVTM